MGKRSWSIALALALIGGALAALPVGAQEAPAPAVPATPNIVDPPGDANFLNSGTAGPLGQDTTTPADASTIGDLLAVWFSHTVDTVSVHWQTEAAPPGGNGIGYQAFSTPGEGEAGSNTVGCLRFALNIPGTNPGGGSYQDTEWVRLLDRCNVGTSIYDDAIDGTYTIHEGPEGTGIVTATFPRSYSPLLADGQTLVTPTAAANSPLIGSHSNGAYASPSTDNTKPGTDYALSAPAGGAGAPTPSEPPGKGDPPGKGKKKGCAKGGGQKKGACPGKKKPKPPAASCAPYAPGEDGAEAQTSVITEAATEEKPVVVEYEAEMGGPSSPLVDAFDFRSFLYHNVQVDSLSPDTGLYVKTEFTEYHDYDLALFHADGTEAASSGESQPVAGAGGGSPDGAWEGGSNYEMVTGIRTADCAGYTVRVAGYLTTGGPVTISMWIGPVVGDPAAPGGGGLASDIFFGALGVRNPMG